MAVFKRGAVWWVHVKRGDQAVRRSAGKGATRADALQLESEIRLQLGAAPAGAKQGLEEALLEWLKGPALGLRSYRESVSHARLLRPHLQGRSISEAPAVAEQAKAEWLASGLKPATINNRLAVLRRIVHLAYDWGWLAHPLHSRIKLLPPRNERHVYLTESQVLALAAAAEEGGAAVLWLAYTGLRAGELWTPEIRELRDGALLLAARTKGGRPRLVPAPGALAELPLPPPPTRQEFRTLWERARQEVGLPGLHLHDLRHTYASLLVQAGASPTALRDLLGHAHLGVTSRYAHLGAGHLWDAVGLLENGRRTE